MEGCSVGSRPVAETSDSDVDLVAAWAPFDDVEFGFERVEKLVAGVSGATNEEKYVGVEGVDKGSHSGGERA